MNTSTESPAPGTSSACDAVLLPTPACCREEQPLAERQAAQIAAHRADISSVLRGRDKRMLAIVGPCSVHSVDQALDYADRLAAARHRFDDALLIAMRVYIEKPRTTVGWRGLALDPALDASQGPEAGLRECRRVMKGVVERGLPVATESLDPFIVPYVEDLLAFSSLGARTSESQTHRQMAASLACPVGIKNATSGNLAIAADAAVAVRSSQSVFKITDDGRVGYRQTAGNAHTALVLRGGAQGPNYSIEHQATARQLLQQRGLDTALIIDCSHGNSEKVARRQIDVAKYISEQIQRGAQPPAGIMIESHLHGGRQSTDSTLQYGVSITDECLGFDDTLQCLEVLANATRSQSQHSLEELAIA